MKSAEKAIIENLRKTTLSHLSEYNYDVVIKEIEKYGITNLTGTTEKLVRQAVNKHGSHDQSSHGRRGGGKGGSGGGTKVSPPSKTQSPQADKDRSGTSKVLVDDMTEAEDSLNDLSGRLIGRGDELQVDRAIRNFTNAKKDFNDAIKLKGKEQTKKMQTGVGNVFAGMNQLSLVDDKRAENIAQSISDELQSTFGSADSAFQSLGVDVDDIFGA